LTASPALFYTDIFCGVVTPGSAKASPDEANFPAKYSQATSHARLPGPDEEQGRAAGPEAPAPEGPPPHRGRLITTEQDGSTQRFRPCERLRRAQDFRTVFRGGSRSEGPLFGLIALPRVEGPSRLGLAVERRVGGAVRRNRAKRLLRECFRRNRPSLALDVVLVAKREILSATQAELEREYHRRLRELERRLPRQRGARAVARD
jgi:ribonuclease P protein component